MKAFAFRIARLDTTLNSTRNSISSSESSSSSSSSSANDDENDDEDDGENSHDEYNSDEAGSADVTTSLAADQHAGVTTSIAIAPPPKSTAGREKKQTKTLPKNPP